MPKEIIKKRLLIIIALLVIYFGTIFTDIIIKKLFFENINNEKEAFKVTLRHFVQPDENIFLNPAQFKQFLDKIVQGKKGVLAWKPFYIILIALYIGSAVLIFVALTKKTP